MNFKLMLNETGKDPLYKIWHTSKQVMLLYVYSGAGSVVTKDRNYPIQENALILIHPGTYHYTMPEEPALYVRSKLFLSFSDYAKLLDLLRNFGEEPALFSRPVVFARIPPEQHWEIHRIFADAALCQTDEGHTPLLLSCALRLLFYLNQYAVESAPVTAGFMGKAIQYINENIARELDLDSICSAVNMSKYYFCRQFKSQLGITVMQYILNTRIVLAKEALEKTNDPVSRIGEKYGFSSTSYFCQAFKAETGHTPLQYRKLKNQ